MRSEAEGIAELFGGKSALRRDFVDIVRAGIPAAAVRKLAEKTHTSISLMGDVARIDKSTLMRRRKAMGRLKPDESDRVLRFARVFALALGVLGADARVWFETKNEALGGIKPIELLDTDSGSREVEQVLGRIEHGVFS